MTDTNWEWLQAAVQEVAGKVYVPYSSYQMGAAVLVDSGRTVVGCNVENAPHGVGLYAECGLVSQLNAARGGRLVAFTYCGRLGEQITPCGRYRQLLFGFGGNRLLVNTPVGVLSTSEVLPQTSGPVDLDHVR